MNADWKNTTAVITGGAGFIGSNLARQLLGSGARVVVLDNFSSGKRRNLDFIAEQGYADRFRLIEDDIRNSAALNEACSGAQVLFHMAAMGSVEQSVAQPELANEINVGGSIKVLQAARDAKLRRVVLSSSAATYGNNPELPKIETMRPEPLSPYASSKIAMEYYAANFHTLYGLETVILRYFNVFGPHQDPTSIYAAVIPIFVHKLLSGVAPRINGDGGQTRDFVHVSDVARANMLAAFAPSNACGRPINVAGGRVISVIDLFSHDSGSVAGRSATGIWPGEGRGRAPFGGGCVGGKGTIGFQCANQRSGGAATLD